MSRAGLTRRAVLAGGLCCALLLAACDRGRSGPAALSRRDALRVGLEQPRTLDPVLATLPAELLIADQLFDSLTSYDPATLEVRPSIADDWKSTEDQRHWDFHIRSGAVFSNRRNVTSIDAKYSIERAARAGSGSPIAVQLEPVTGYHAFNTDPKLQSIAGITTPSLDWLHIDLDQPFSSLPAVLAHPALGIVPRESVEAASPAFGERPVGSGPLMLASRDAQVLHLRPAPGSKMALKGLDFVLEGDVGASYTAFGRGDLDWSAVPADRIDEAAEKYGRSGFRPYLVEVLYGLNLRSPKFADVRFREAIVRAIDRDAIASAVYGGAVRDLRALVPAGVPGAQTDPCRDLCGHNPDAARALVSQAFVGKPVPQVNIDYDDSTTQEAVAKAIQSNLTDVGIPAAVRAHPYSEFLRFATSGQQELFHFGSSGGYPSPDAFLTPLFMTGVADNVTGFSSKAVDELLKSARADSDTVRRTAFYQEAERQILSQFPVAPIAQYEVRTVVSKRVKGLVMSALGTFDATKVRLG